MAPNNPASATPLVVLLSRLAESVTAMVELNARAGAWERRYPSGAKVLGGADPDRSRALTRRLQEQARTEGLIAALVNPVHRGALRGAGVVPEALQDEVLSLVAMPYGLPREDAAMRAAPILEQLGTARRSLMQGRGSTESPAFLVTPDAWRDRTKSVDYRVRQYMAYLGNSGSTARPTSEAVAKAVDAKPQSVRRSKAWKQWGPASVVGTVADNPQRRSRRQSDRIDADRIGDDE